MAKRVVALCEKEKENLRGGQKPYACIRNKIPKSSARSMVTKCYNLGFSEVTHKLIYMLW